MKFPANILECAHVFHPIFIAYGAEFNGGIQPVRIFNEKTPGDLTG